MFKNYMEKYMAKFRKTKVYGVTEIGRAHV